MGMFSTLNYLIDAPLEEILEQIPPVRRGEGGAFASHRAVRYAL